MSADHKSLIARLRVRLQPTEWIICETDHLLAGGGGKPGERQSPFERVRMQRVIRLGGVSHVTGLLTRSEVPEPDLLYWLWRVEELRIPPVGR